MDDDRKQMESVDFDLTIDYSGGLGIAIDVALAYGKSAFLSAKGINGHTLRLPEIKYDTTHVLIIMLSTQCPVLKAKLD